MTNFLRSARHFLGIETAAESAVWEDRLKTLEETVGLHALWGTLDSQRANEVAMLREANPRAPASVLEFAAESRLTIRALCRAKCALPARGITVPQLRTLGFDTGIWGTERRFGMVLRVVGFPDGWGMQPAFTETGLDKATFAVVTDETDAQRLKVEYELPVYPAPPRAYTRLLSSDEAAH